MVTARSTLEGVWSAEDLAKTLDGATVTIEGYSISAPVKSAGGGAGGGCSAAQSTSLGQALAASLGVQPSDVSVQCSSNRRRNLLSGGAGRGLQQTACSNPAAVYNTEVKVGPRAELVQSSKQAVADTVQQMPNMCAPTAEVRQA